MDDSEAKEAPHVNAEVRKEEVSQHSAIVFAEQKVTCIAIARILQICQKDTLKHVKCSGIAGANDSLAGLATTSSVSTRSTDSQTPVCSTSN